MVDAAGCEFNTILRSEVLPVVMVFPSFELIFCIFNSSSTPHGGISTFTKFIPENKE